MRRPEYLQFNTFFTRRLNFNFMQPYQSLSEHIHNIAVERTERQINAELTANNKEGFEMYDTIYEQRFLVSHHHFFRYLFNRGVVAHCEDYDNFLLNMFRNRKVLVKLNEYYWTEWLRARFADERGGTYHPNLFYLEDPMPVGPTLDVPFPSYDPYEHMN